MLSSIFFKEDAPLLGTFWAETLKEKMEIDTRKIQRIVGALNNEYK